MQHCADQNPSQVAWLGGGKDELHFEAAGYLFIAKTASFRNRIRYLFSLPTQFY